MTTIHLGWLLSSSLLCLAAAVFVTASCRLRRLSAYLLAVYVLAYADIVLVLEVAGLLHAVTSSAVLGLQALLTAGAVLVWWRLGRPPLLEPVQTFRVPRPRWDWRLVLKVLALVLLVVTVTYMYTLRAGVILATHPSNYDARTYHLTRVGYWLQYQSFYPWPTPNARQTTFPMNAELGVLWTVLWWGTDRLSGFVQWISVPAIMAGMYGLARLMRYARWPSAVGALLWATLPQTLYQSSTTQNDLVTSAFWVATVYFLILGSRAKKPIPLYLSGISLGLAIGTKSTSIFAAPGLAMLAFGILWERRWRRSAWQAILRWAVASVVGIALLGSYIYVQNTVAFGNPLGASSPRTGPEVLKADRGVRTFAARLRDNLGRYTYQLVDFSPLPKPIPRSLNPGKAAFFGTIYESLGVKYDNRDTMSLANFGLDFVNGLDENTSWFGPLAIFLMAAVVVQAVSGFRHRDALVLGLALMFLSFLVLSSAAQKWTPYKGRYFVLPVSVSFPLICMFVVPRNIWRTVLAVAVMLLGVVVMFTVTQDERMLRGIGWSRVFAAERYPPGWSGIYSFALFDRVVPEDASLGLEGGIDYTDYHFFGEEFGRYVTLAVPEEPSLLPRTNIERFVTDFWNSDYLFLRSGRSSTNYKRAAEEFTLLSDDGVNSLWIRRSLRTTDECEGDSWPFKGLLESSSTAVCPRFPIFPGAVEGGGAGLIYLRDGILVPRVRPASGGTFGFDLLARESSDITISLRVVPADKNVTHTVRLIMSGAGDETQLFDKSFSKSQTIKFPLELEPGEYRLEFRLMVGPNEARILGVEISDR